MIPQGLPLLPLEDEKVKQRGAILAMTVGVAYQRLSELFVGQDKWALTLSEAMGANWKGVLANANNEEESKHKKSPAQCGAFWCAKSAWYSFT